jgi:redox-sensitive bicupin YhaK (pirin superfamily)
MAAPSVSDLIQDTPRRNVTEANTPMWTAGPPCEIVCRTRGNRHGPITRLMSPGDLGELLKPFVFLDLFEMDKASFPGIGLHPHSGIVTVTYLFEGSIRYEDTTGATGVLPHGGVEWFKAAHGAWHGGGPGDAGDSRGFQLWLALPPDEELGPVENIYLSPDAVASDSPARILVGSHGGATSSLKAPVPLNYLAVRLRTGESWRYQPDVNHTVCWVALSTGGLLVPDRVEAGELAIFEPGNNAIDIYAKADADFVLGSAAAHSHDLVLGNYSVHTSTATLRAGEQRIKKKSNRRLHLSSQWHWHSLGD